MIVHTCEQGSPEWKRLRAGRPTASLFHVMREANKLTRGPEAGDYKAEAKDLAFRLAIERIGGEPLDEGYETWAMERGHRLEPEARREHENQMGHIVTRVGFITTDDGRFGASLDGLIDDDGSSEYKAFVDPLKVRKIHISGDLSMVMDQVQGGLWISDRQWMELCLYCPALKSSGRHLWVKRIYRDDDYIEELERDVFAFNLLVDDYERVLRQPMSTEPVQSAKIITKAQRKLPARPETIITLAPGLPLTRFEKLCQRVDTAKTAVEVELILDGADDLDTAEVLELVRRRDARFPMAGA